MKPIKLTPINLKSHPTLDERWVQQAIADDPAILGLGDVILKDKERIQAAGGRLDILLQDEETKARYEVEIQLGPTDPSHIIRAIEYWDVERKRYPQYDHTAVIVAEDITSRFLNVISLFNGAIPIIAIQMKALQTDAGVALFFTKVLDTIQQGLVDEDEEVNEPCDRAYWEGKVPPGIVKLTDKIRELCQGFSENLELTYNRHYIGFRVDGRPCNFVVCYPKRAFLRVEMRLPQAEDLDARILADGLDGFVEYNARWKQYRLRLDNALIAKHAEFLRDIFKRAYDRRNSE